MKKKNDKQMAVRSESIVEARFSLTGKQNDILDMLFSEIENDDKCSYELSVDKYKAIYNTDTSNIYRDLKKAVKSFETKGFYIIDKINNQEIYYAWFSKIYYKNNDGKIVVDIHKDLKKMLYEVKKKIYYDINYTLNFSSNYSKRLYYYLKSYEDTKWRKDKVEVLLKKLECPTSYEEFKFFKKYVLEVAKKEINSTSDIFFDYELEKVGRKVEYIIFSIHKKQDVIANSELAIDDIRDISIDYMKVVISEKMSSEDLNKVYKVLDELDISKTKFENKKDYFIRNYELASRYYNNTCAGDGVFVAILISALKDNWTKNKSKGLSSKKKPNVKKKTKKGSFNDYEQREYDFNDLEWKLLGWNNVPEGYDEE